MAEAMTRENVTSTAGEALARGRLGHGRERTGCAAYDQMRKAGADLGLACGLNTRAGALTHDAVAAAFA